ILQSGPFHKLTGQIIAQGYFPKFYKVGIEHMWCPKIPCIGNGERDKTGTVQTKVLLLQYKITVFIMIPYHTRIEYPIIYHGSTQGFRETSLARRPPNGYKVFAKNQEIGIIQYPIL